jgi:outer membrane scaffolding protein for murein synthesis (MipA/OmpV family)
VFIEGNRAGLPLKRFAFGTLSALGQVRTHQYLDADNTSLTDEDRDPSIELGPQLSIPLGQGFVSQFSVLQDISGKHKAQEYEAAIYKRFVFNSLRIIATVAAQYQSRDLMNYYTGTNTYQPKAELTQELELLGVYDINKNWSAVAVWRYYQHGSEFKNSPLTDGQTTQRTAIGIGYHF